MGLPGFGLGESVILRLTPAPSWQHRQKTSQRAPSPSRSASIMKQPVGLKASSPLPPSSPIPTSPLPSQPIEQKPEPEHQPELVEEAPSEHLSDDPFGFLSAKRKLRAKEGQPTRVNKGRDSGVDRQPGITRGAGGMSMTRTKKSERRRTDPSPSPYPCVWPTVWTSVN